MTQPTRENVRDLIGMTTIIVLIVGQMLLTNRYHPAMFQDDFELFAMNCTLVALSIVFGIFYSIGSGIILVLLSYVPVIINSSITIPLLSYCYR